MVYVPPFPSKTTSSSETLKVGPQLSSHLPKAIPLAVSPRSTKRLNLSSRKEPIFLEEKKWRNQNDLYLSSPAMDLDGSDPIKRKEELSRLVKQVNRETDLDGYDSSSDSEDDSDESDDSKETTDDDENWGLYQMKLVPVKDKLDPYSTVFLVKENLVPHVEAIVLDRSTQTYEKQRKLRFPTFFFPPFPPFPPFFFLLTQTLRLSRTSIKGFDVLERYFLYT